MCQNRWKKEREKGATDNSKDVQMERAATTTLPKSMVGLTRQAKIKRHPTCNLMTANGCGQSEDHCANEPKAMVAHFIKLVVSAQ